MTPYARRIRVAILATAMVALLWPGPVLANGRVKRLVPQDAGPYTISLGTIPQAPALGSLHLTMTVVERSSGAFIMDARVSVTGTGPSGVAAEIGPLVAQKNPLAPTFYDISTSVDREGTWTFTVGVSGKLGDASSDFSIEVARASPLTGIATLFGFLAFLTVLGLSVRVFLRQQPGSSGRGGGRKR